MEKKKMSGRIVAAALGAAMFLSYAACRKTEKKSARKTEVLETDPYFDVEMTELALPIDESKALQFKNISEARVCGDTVRSVTCAISKDEALINIVKDEADGYFTGSRTVEDVLANIDKRAAQVVKEK